ncbi:MAG TPA: minor capsid protein [Bacillota bacterium]|nr:minor capsid protein [Bacillota bacterium]
MRVVIELERVKAKLSQERVNRGRFALANQALADMDQFVPKLEGDLRTATSVEADGTAINYNMPYARAQFYGFVGGGYPISNYTTPGTGPRWDLKATSMFIEDWKRAFVEGADW